nr:MAG TPA: hypothetical protein [Caudoviricetes sp.]DAU95090.1 MAG TPA: hypothetical protein [Caudoviricetes sp.]
MRQLYSRFSHIIFSLPIIWSAKIHIIKNYTFY